MNTNQKNPLHKVAEQIANNSTGWIGQVPGNTEHFVKGQTFVADEEGDLRNIKVFSNLIARNTNIMMTLYNYDPQSQSWGRELGSASVELKRTDADKWISFDIPGPHLNKGQSYGFRLESQDSYIGVGEACGSFKQPAFKAGKEWQFTKGNPGGDSFSYFSLAFKVEVAA